ncbi:MAG: hypothetical protein ACREGD_03860 [Candidatus Saccharimonadales bacterium]
MMAKTQDGAELLQAATGRLDVFEVVQDVDGELVVHPTRPGAPPVPVFAAKAVDSVGEDEEIVRLAIVLSDPLYVVEIPPMTVTAAEIRERAEAELRASPLRWHWYRMRIWLYHWRRV